VHLLKNELGDDDGLKFFLH